MARDRSTVVETAKCRAEHGTLTVFFYCGEANREHQAMAVMSSSVKQICDYLLSTSSPIPQEIEREIKKIFGPKHMKPDFEDIENIFSRLFFHVPNTIYVLDGLDLVESGQARSVLKCIRSFSAAIVRLTDHRSYWSAENKCQDSSTYQRFFLAYKSSQRRQM
jgi:hypothetical protein